MARQLESVSPSEPNQFLPRTRVIEPNEVRVRLLRDREKVFVGVLRRVTTGYMEITSPTCLLPGQDVEVLHQGCDIDCRVVHSKEIKKTHFDVKLRLVRSAGIDMRSEPRIPVDLEATLFIVGKSRAYSARVIDISSAGMGVKLPITLPVGESVLLDLGHGLAFGEIRYCRSISGAFVAGLHLSEFIMRERVPLPPLLAVKKSVETSSIKRIMAMIREKRVGEISSEDPDSSLL